MSATALLEAQWEAIDTLLLDLDGNAARPGF